MTTSLTQYKHIPAGTWRICEATSASTRRNSVNAASYPRRRNENIIALRRRWIDVGLATCACEVYILLKSNTRHIWVTLYKLCIRTARILGRVFSPVGEPSLFDFMVSTRRIASYGAVHLLWFDIKWFHFSKIGHASSVDPQQIATKQYTDPVFTVFHMVYFHYCSITLWSHL